MLSSRHPDALEDLAAEIGPRASVGTVLEAAEFGEVVLVAVPFKALAELGRVLGDALAGKVVLDACNPNVRRDGEVAQQVERSGQGSGVYTAQVLSGALVVKAFNTVYFQTLRDMAHAQGDPVGVPLASDHPEALEAAAELVRDAGFEPANVGALTNARFFDPGSLVFNTGMRGSELKRTLARIIQQFRPSSGQA
jgi:hypothetical protein